MNVIDSSAWLEYFTDGANADFFAPAIEDVKHLIVPTLCLYEVFKKVLQEQGENAALQIAVIMQQGHVVDFDASMALHAAKISHELKLPLADSIILAAARQYKALLWTQDTDFKGLPGIKFKEKRK